MKPSPLTAGPNNAWADRAFYVSWAPAMIAFDNTYTRLPERFFSKSAPAQAPEPKLIRFNQPLAEQLNLDLSGYDESQLARFFSGREILPGAEPVALAYAGHQFGNFVPQLGDGRAVLLGEVVADSGRYDIQLKGSGRTVFSRGGDGKSALGPVLREYIVSEAMHRLGVPTTRALAAVLTGEEVYREEALPGGVFTRVASSHIRVGTFQFFAARGDSDGVRTLADYAVQRHYPHLKDVDGPEKYLQFLLAVAHAQAELVGRWMSYGFIHGVMNTDNTSISGETIDYGPCAFMDNFNFSQVFSSIDRGGRYSYENQGPIAHWNMYRLAECLVPLLGDDAQKAAETLTQHLESLPDSFQKEHLGRMNAKLGLAQIESEDSSAEGPVQLFLSYLQEHQFDFTLSFRALGELVPKLMAAGDGEGIEQSVFPQSDSFTEFLLRWQRRLKAEQDQAEAIVASMNTVNPVFIPRNHQIERAIYRAYHGDFTLFHDLNEVLKSPFEEQEKFKHLKEAPKPDQRVKATFCGT